MANYIPPDSDPDDSDGPEEEAPWFPFIRATDMKGADLKIALDDVKVTALYLESKEAERCSRTLYSFEVKSVPVKRVRVTRGPRGRSAHTPTRVIKQPPGTRLARWGRFLLTKEAYRRYVYPVIADMQHEYCEAIAAGEEFHAKWIWIRGWLLVVPGWIVGVAGQFVKKMFSA